MQLSHNCALVIVDMQNGFCSPEGFMARMLKDITHQASVIEVNIKVLAAARKTKIPIIFMRYSLRADYSDGGIMVKKYPNIQQFKGLIAGSWDADVIDDLKPDVCRGEIVLDKTRYSAFWNTSLQQILVEKCVDQIILTGVSTNVCVEGTARDAFANGFEVILVEDATGAGDKERHEAAIRSMGETHADVVNSHQLFEALKHLEQGHLSDDA